MVWCCHLLISTKRPFISVAKCLYISSVYRYRVTTTQRIVVTTHNQKAEVQQMEKDSIVLTKYQLECLLQNKTIRELSEKNNIIKIRICY